MSRDTVRQLVVVLAIIATLVVNGLANALPLNGLTTGEISDRFDVYFVPAGYVFAIWGLIYVGLIAYGIFQALPVQRANPRLRAIGYPFVASAAANIAWLFLWHYERFAWTLVAMIALLVLLITIYVRLGVGVVRVSAGERWLVHLPFSIYLGWISVATIANVTDVLDYNGWTGGGIAPEMWAMIMLAAGVILALLMAATRGDVAYGLVLIWAFVGIAIKQADTAEVATAAWVAAGLVVVAIVAAMLYRRAERGEPTAGRAAA